ncbi:MAG: hypothetical protein GF332_03425 [Candidatus Moranbacteria bacterium]|nr:hypothetical protein [Candidatus Moranbacteria bacterium]
MTLKTKQHPVDKSNFQKVIQEIPEQFLDSKPITKSVKLTRRNFDSLVVCGMGGSAMPYYLLEMCSNLVIPVFLHNNYGLPSKLTAKPLFFISSFSGNTEETISAFRAVIKKGYSAVGFSNGGQLQDLCKKHEIPHVYYQIQNPDFQPRCALPLAFTGMYRVLAQNRLVSINPKSIDRLADFIQALDQKQIQNKARQLAGFLKKQTPVFYAPFHLRFTALINKIKINENAKVPAFWNFYPELNHNEMNGYQNGDPKKFIIVSFQDNDQAPKNRQRARITNQLLTNLNYNVMIVETQGQSILEKVFYILYFGEWLSYYLAISLNQDPTPVQMVEDFKKKLK